MSYWLDFERDTTPRCLVEFKVRERERVREAHTYIKQSRWTADGGGDTSVKIDTGAPPVPACGTFLNVQRECDWFKLELPFRPLGCLNVNIWLSDILVLQPLDSGPPQRDWRKVEERRKSSPGVGMRERERRRWEVRGGSIEIWREKFNDKSGGKDLA